MAPLLWLNLFIFFTIIYTLFLISNYFIKIPSAFQASYKTQLPNKFNWKW
uniref:ATP synthase Fo subunit 8 n=1 Tax=Caridina meridionalis TaxID=2494437 RepID=A0A3S5XE17_9EUCA|nr:ATP synthase Fo subunit 8 [Caridina meridionalis]AZH80592.1 ATP synthase Fo subunit 8 [Caridina meridionalis]